MILKNIYVEGMFDRVFRVQPVRSGGRGEGAGRGGAGRDYAEQSAIPVSGPFRRGRK